MEITSAGGVTYDIGKRLGRGGVAKVYRARRISDGKEFAFKVYKPDPEKPQLARIHKNIRKNLINLIKNPIRSKDGKPLASFVGPLDLVDNLADGGFGYIMDLVDMDNYRPLLKLWNPKNYPDAEILCRIGKNISEFFSRIHASGYCYKDINEGNIYINPKTGDVRIIDADNINEKGVYTITGTSGYIAPEVYTTSCPDERSDLFSMATYFYRLMVGGYPLDGQKTERYLLDNQKAVAESGSMIYGTMALFAFDPVDPSNGIRGVTTGFSDDQIAKWQEQTRYWDDLPQEIRKCFIQTFSTCLPEAKKSNRTSDRMWYDTFDELQKNGLVKCRCGKHNFAGRASGKCLFCDKPLPKPKTKPLPQKTGSGPKKVPAPPAPAPVPAPAVTTNHITKVRFAVQRDIAPQNLSVTAKMLGRFPGDKLHPALGQGELMRIEYNPQKDLLGAVNLTRHTWSVVYGGRVYVCQPNARVILKKGMIISVLTGQLEMKVMEFL